MSHRGEPPLRSRLIPALLCLLLIGCGEDNGESSSPGSEAESVAVTVPDLSETARRGADLFEANCSECHSADAGGTSEGPPLVHIYYEPGHHADFSFHIAVRQGTPQHHWEFGDMDPVPGLSDGEVNEIICYVRELQYANDIFTDPAGLAACQS
ncbi:MAG: cytochrome c [bacterium]|nr:cytochrome c [bacterium]